MARPGATGEGDLPAADALALEEPLQPVRAGGPGRPIALIVATAAILATLVWQPWGSTGPRVAPSSSPSVAVAVAPSAAAVETPASPSPTATLRGPRPSFSGGALASATYLSLGDNEWSVVALLAPDRLAAADQAWVADATGAPEAPGGPLLVLQLPATFTDLPTETSDDPAAVCRAGSAFRYYVSAYFPKDRVAYLGVTIPAIEPRVRVSAVVLDRRGLVLKRLPVVSVRLSGMTEGVRYTIPTSGSGGAALFALAPRAIMPVGAYRFDIEWPGVSGQRYLYACIDP